MVTGFPGPIEDYKVVCDCKTYNQSKFIEDTMNGFAIQQTNFPYVCVIMDDASTDGEQDVIKSYLNSFFDMKNAVYYDIETANVVVVRHLINPNCTFAVYLLKRNLRLQPELKREHLNPWTNRCEFVAYCEGDDFWTDPGKLQKQVNLMTGRSDVSLCYHPVKFLAPDGKSHLNKFDGIPIEATERDIAKMNFITTQSVMVRYDPDVALKVFSLGKMPFGDYSTWMLYSQRGILYRLADTMAVYREGTGVWSTKSRFEQLLYSSAGYNKLYLLVQDAEAKSAFDDNINSLLKSIESEYFGILNSWDYKLGNFFMKYIRHVRDILKFKKL